MEEMIPDCNFDQIAFNPSPLSQLPALFGGAILLATAFYFRVQGIWMENSDVVLAVAMAPGLVGVALLLCVVWRCFNHRLCFCDSYVSRYSGLLGTNLRTSRLLYHHVRGVEIEQSILGRILKVGDIHVGSDNSRPTSEIVIRGVRHPEKIKDQLMARVEQVQSVLATAGAAQQVATQTPRSPAPHSAATQAV